MLPEPAVAGIPKFSKIFLEAREAGDRVRMDRANEFRHDKPVRKPGKGSRWSLLKNSSNLNAQQTVSLEELLRGNQPLSTVYILAEQLKAIYGFRDNESFSLRK